jgi:hypothetical protein
MLKSGGAELVPSRLVFNFRLGTIPCETECPVLGRVLVVYQHVAFQSTKRTVMTPRRCQANAFLEDVFTPDGSYVCCPVSAIVALPFLLSTCSLRRRNVQICNRPRAGRHSLAYTSTHRRVRHRNHMNRRDNSLLQSIAPGRAGAARFTRGCSDYLCRSSAAAQFISLTNLWIDILLRQESRRSHHRFGGWYH